MSGIGPLLLVAAIAVTALATGRLLVAGFGGRLYRRFEPAGAAASLAVGAAALTLLSVTLSGVGFPTADLPPLVAALLLVPLATCAKRRRLGALRLRGSLLEWTMFAGPLALAAWLALLPVSRAGGVWFGNDTYTYCAFSEWLQGHGFSEPARWEVQSPATAIPSLWQSQHYDLGIAHWLALVQAAVRPPGVLLVYPQTSAFGLVVLAAVVWLAALQLLRLPRAWACAAALLFALVPHALYWGHHNGFLQQEYALAFVLFGVVLVARLAPRRRRRASDAALLALPFAFLASVYLPLMPLAGLAALVGFLPAALRARRTGEWRQLALFVALVFAFTVVYSARDVLGALSPLHGFATHVAGGHVPWKAADFFQFALGTRVLAPGWINVEAPPWSAVNRALTPLHAALALSGLWLAARWPRTRPLAGAAALVAVGALYFALVKDPWSGERGHTWNLFKLAQWSWPFALLLGGLAVRRLAPTRTPWRLGALALAFALPASQVGVHAPWATSFGEAMREILPGATFAQLGDLRRRVQELPPGNLLVVGRPVNAQRWLATALSLLAYPRSVVGDWADSGTVTNHPVGGQELYVQLLGRWNEPHVVPILAGYVPFQPGAAPLGGGLARLPSGARALLVHVVNPAGLVSDSATGRPRFSVGKGRTKLVVFSRQAQSVVLALRLRPYPGRPGTRLQVFQAPGDYSHRSVRLASQGEPVALLPLGGETSLEAPLTLPGGLSTLVLILDDGSGALDAREPVTVTHVSFGP
jgi:hypothetical protein